MVTENPVPPFPEWIGPAALFWISVVGGLVAASVAVGLLFAVLRHGPSKALRMTENVLAGGLVDLLRISPRRVAALAWLGVKESIRRPVLVNFLVFVLVLLFASWFLDPNSTEPARLYMGFVLTVSSYLVLLLLLFLSVFSIPADIRSRTLHTIVTKPVRPSEIVLGRMLGFALVGTGLLVVMGVMSYWFVVRGMAHTHELTAGNLKAVTQVRAVEGQPPLEGLTEPAHGHQHAVRIDSSGKGRIETGRRHWHELEIEGSGNQAVYTVGPEQGSLMARVPVYGKIRFRDREGIDTDKGINVGNEWMYRSYIQGGSPAAAMWTFEGLRPEQFPDFLPVEMNIEIFRSHKGKIKEGVLGEIGVRNPENGIIVWTEIFQAKEYATKSLTIPVKLERKKVARIDVVQRKIRGSDGKVVDSPATIDPSLARQGETEPIDLYRDIAVDGKLEIWLR
ncbi:MAG: hypothetical protein FJ276_37570, partial [Planctomycetes bacterium]|nr:hypothetical protein [Planctomycetota bacterium]